VALLEQHHHSKRIILSITSLLTPEYPLAREFALMINVALTASFERNGFKVKS